MRMTSGWSFSDCAITTGCSRSPSSWFTAMTIATTMSATTGPFATSATSAARMPATVAPTSGMNAVRNTMTESGRASGTCRITRPMPIATASTSATIAVPRT